MGRGKQEGVVKGKKKGGIYIRRALACGDAVVGILRQQPGEQIQQKDYTSRKPLLPLDVDCMVLTPSKTKR